MLSDPEQVSNLLTPRGLAMLTGALVITGKPKAEAEEKKKRENKGSGEKGMGLKEDRAERRRYRKSGRELQQPQGYSLSKHRPGGIITQERLRPCLFVH